MHFTTFAHAKSKTRETVTECQATSYSTCPRHVIEKLVGYGTWLHGIGEIGIEEVLQELVFKTIHEADCRPHLPEIRSRHDVHLY